MHRVIAVDLLSIMYNIGAYDKEGVMFDGL